MDRRRHRKNHHSHTYRAICSKTAARAIRSAWKERRMTTTYSKHLKRRRLFSPRAWPCLFSVAIALALLPQLNLVFPADHPLHISSYAIGLTGKYMCYAIAALALD